MGYAGICGVADLQANSNDYFHVKSLEQIIAYVSSGGGSGCAATVSTGNTAPMVSAGANFTIPQLTPFKLTATGSDPDSDPLTYCWEEYDLGTASPPEGDDGSRPIFRSYSPTAGSSRTFPSLTYILNNANNPPATYMIGMRTFATGEVLPSTNRTMNFQVTARDNRAGGGGINTSTMQVTVTTGAGPFNVTSPDTAIVWPVGSAQTVTWNVANTTAAPVSCPNVNIMLSTDDGTTFPITLAASTPNDGSHAITVPPASSLNARVKVEAVGNIFFDISNSNFTVNAPPSITCPSNITVGNDAGLCSAVVTFTATATDDLSVPTVGCAPSSGSVFPKGTTTVTCTATDSVGATDMCSFTVTVNDIEAPSIICPVNITQSTDPGLCTAVVTYAAPTVSDNCPGVGSATCMPASGTTFAKGTTTVLCTVSDSSSNSSICSFTVTVNDTEPPTIICPANITTVSALNVCSPPAGTVVTYSPPTVNDNCPGPTWVCVPPSGSAFPLGATTVTCTATDTSSNTASCSFVVTVYDVCLQDDSSPSTVLLWNSATGDYLLCAAGGSYTGRGRSMIQGCIYTLNVETTARRIMARIDKTGFKGSASAQIPVGRMLCAITDRNTRNNSCACAP
jgi:hypothetical protein